MIDRPESLTAEPDWRIEPMTAEYAAATRDYNVCLSAPDGVHDPRIAEYQQPELIDIGYVTIECALCGQTTGYPLVDIDPAKVDW